MRTWKKIEETKKRAGEIMRLKQRQNEKAKMKADRMEYEMLANQQTVEKHQQNRQQSE